MATTPLSMLPPVLPESVRKMFCRDGICCCCCMATNSLSSCLKVFAWLILSVLCYWYRCCYVVANATMDVITGVECLTEALIIMCLWLFSSLFSCSCRCWWCCNRCRSKSRSWKVISFVLCCFLLCILFQGHSFSYFMIINKTKQICANCLQDYKQNKIARTCEQNSCGSNCKIC